MLLASATSPIKASRGAEIRAVGTPRVVRSLPLPSIGNAFFILPAVATGLLLVSLLVYLSLGLSPDTYR